MRLKIILNKFWNLQNWSADLSDSKLQWFNELWFLWIKHNCRRSSMIEWSAQHRNFKSDFSFVFQQKKTFFCQKKLLFSTMHGILRFWSSIQDFQVGPNSKSKMLSFSFMLIFLDFEYLLWIISATRLKSCCHFNFATKILLQNVAFFRRKPCKVNLHKALFHFLITSLFEGEKF